MHYKYKKIVTEGAYGTTIGHRSSDENKITTLGNIGEYTYIYAETLGEQPEDLIFEETTLTKEEILNMKCSFIKKQEFSRLMNVFYKNIKHEWEFE